MTYWISEQVFELEEHATCPICGNAIRLHRLETAQMGFWWRLVCSWDWRHIVDIPAPALAPAGENQ